MKTRWVIEQVYFRHKATGEIVTQIPIMQIGDYEKVEAPK